MRQSELLAQFCAALLQKRLRHPDSFRHLHPMRTQQVERHAFTLPIIEQRYQSFGTDILGNVEPGLVRDAMPGQRPASGDFTVIAEVVAVDFHFERFIAATETPGVVGTAVTQMEQGAVLA